MESIAVRFVRGQTTESVHRASVAVADVDGRVVASFGDPKLVTYLRSAAKPFQSLPFVESGAAERFGGDPRFVAIAASSHSGEPVHTELVRDLLARFGLDASLLRCGAHAPLDEAAAATIGKAFTPLHHNCSGLHAGMLAACVHQGLDTASYAEPGHPLQQHVRAVVAALAGLRPEELGVGVDGCAIPTYAIPLRNAARAYARLGDPSRVRGATGRALSQVRDAMIAHPQVVGGTQRTDTEFMQAFSGRLLVKAGAEACYGAALPKEGLGIVVKIEDGNPRAIGPLLLRVLEDLGILGAAERTVLVRFWGEPLRNTTGQPVGQVVCDARLKFHAAARSAAVLA